MRVQVHLRAERLGNIARWRWLGRRSNPYASVSIAGRGGRPGASATGLVRLDDTEVVENDLSPRWTRIIILEHRDWTPLLIKVFHRRRHDGRKNAKLNSSSIRDADSAIDGAGGADREGDPTMGEARVEAGEVLRTRGQEAELPLEHGGTLFVHITESAIAPTRGVRPVSGVFHCHIRGLDLENIEKGLLGLGAIDPYFELSKKYLDPDVGHARWHPVHRSEHVPDIINPYWYPFRIDLERLCHGHLGTPLRITVWDYERRRAHRRLGDVECTVGGLIQSVSDMGNASRDRALAIRGREGGEIGLVVVLRAEIEPDRSSRQSGG